MRWNLFLWAFVIGFLVARIRQLQLWRRHRVAQAQRLNGLRGLPRYIDMEAEDAALEAARYARMGWAKPERRPPRWDR